MIIYLTGISEYSWFFLMDCDSKNVDWWGWHEIFFSNYPYSIEFVFNHSIIWSLYDTNKRLKRMAKALYNSSYSYSVRDIRIHIQPLIYPRMHSVYLGLIDSLANAYKLHCLCCHLLYILDKFKSYFIHKTLIEMKWKLFTIRE